MLYVNQNGLRESSGNGTVEDPEVRDLLDRARRGDSAAFARLCERYRSRLWRVVSSVTRGGADTEDLAQEAILRAWSSLRSYRGEASFEGWLCRIALNAAHDYQRSAWRKRVFLWDRSPLADSGGQEEGATSLPGGGSLVSPSPHGEAERREVQRRVRTAVASLTTKERVPIWLIYFEEFSLAEVARLEGVPESTLRSRVRAGLKRLERQLGDLALAETDVSRNNNDGESPDLGPGSNTPATMAAAVVWKGCSA